MGVISFEKKNREQTSIYLTPGNQESIAKQKLYQKQRRTKTKIVEK